MPMSQLNAYLNEIESEKETKIIPQNIPKGLTVLGVPGNSKYCIEVDIAVANPLQVGINYFITKVNGLNLKKFNGTNLTNLFYNYPALLEASVLFSNKITVIDNMFRNCTSLKNVDLTESDTENVISATYMFASCYALQDIGVLNLPKLEAATSMFSTCMSLTNEGLNNILAFLANGTRISASNKTLQKLGLTSAQATTCTGLSNWSAAQAAGWSTGY